MLLYAVVEEELQEDLWTRRFGNYCTVFPPFKLKVAASEVSCVGSAPFNSRRTMALYSRAHEQSFW